jgi:hypothetical protein
LKRTSARLALALVVAGLPLVACGTLLGIDHLPIVDDDAADQSSEQVVTTDAGCEVSKQMCGCVPHDFCDDFDVDGEALGSRWSGALGLSNPFNKGDASMDFAAQALSPPRAAQTRAGEDKASSFSILSQQLDHAMVHPGRAFVGFRYAVDLQLETLVVTEPRGPLVDSGSAVAASVLHFDGPAAKGVALIVAPDGAYLLTAASLLDIQSLDGGSGAITRIFEGDILALGRSWLRVELVVTNKQRAMVEGFSSCAAVAEGPVAAASLGPARVKQACLALPVAIGIGWAEQPVVSAGGVLFAGGTLVMRQDNVAFDFLAP